MTAAQSQGRVLVVGGGISGVACARRLHDAGTDVLLVDRGRRLGGRMAGRTVDTVVGRHVVDTGASYFTVRGEEFGAVVESWRERGLLRRWTDTFHLSDGERLLGTKVGPVRWAGTDGLRSLVEDLADGLAVDNPREVTEVERLTGADRPGVVVDGERFDTVVLAMPDPQAVDLLPEGTAPSLLDGPPWDWRPVLSVYAAWTARTWPEIDGVFVDGSPVVEWVADDGRRRGDGAPVLVAHTTPVFAASRLDDPASAVPHVLADLSRVLGTDLGEPEWARAHRWSLASPSRPRPAPEFALTDDGTVGVCGDAWGERSRIEAAWLSGHRLAGELLQRSARASS
ncbi:NAD(P)/FAD-dependent oxidoreductase [Aquipuribacter sp. MA13-6]|uniref:NAD(P)/FAD-dependent oxidoreductase n=1 Tax=unclassified Aquipuribacter TaxID=2635084 RepID=UPI003EED24CB